MAVPVTGIITHGLDGGRRVIARATRGEMRAVDHHRVGEERIARRRGRLEVAVERPVGVAGGDLAHAVIRPVQIPRSWDWAGAAGARAAAGGRPQGTAAVAARLTRGA